MSRGPRWKPWEVQFLRNNADKLTAREIGGELGKSKCAVGAYALARCIALTAAESRTEVYRNCTTWQPQVPLDGDARFAALMIGRTYG